MKKLLISIFAAFFCISATATNMLSVDSMKIYGNHLANLSQHLVANIRNNTESGYEGHIYLLALNKSDGSVTTCIDTLFAVSSYNSRTLEFFPALPKGDFELRLSTDADGQQIIGISDITILPLRKLDFKAMLSLDMLAKAEDQYVLYGNRIHGWVRVENHDDSYFGIHGGKAEDDGIVLWLEDSDTGERFFTKHLAAHLRKDCYMETAFAHDTVLHEGAHYALKVGYGMPYGLEAIDSLCFTAASGTYSYWTFDGQVLPLPVSDVSTFPIELVVPAEAVAVDLRGHHDSDTSPRINTSQANPNCLYYLESQDDVPEGLDEKYNIVKGLEATNIKLTERHDYYCPLAFRTQFISYLMTPSYDNEDSELRGRGYSKTLVLPFTPTHVMLYDINGNTEVLHSDMIQLLRYYGTHADTLNLSRCEIAQMHPYAPYILGVYIGSSLLFIGENVAVPMTQEAIVRDKLFNFVGTTVARRLTNRCYVYEPEETCFRQYTDDDSVEAFQAYLDAVSISDATATTLSISDSAWGPKGNPNNATIPTVIKSIKETSNNTATIYDLTGRQIRQPQPVERPLSKGVYIIGGHKVIVK